MIEQGCCILSHCPITLLRFKLLSCILRFSEMQTPWRLGRKEIKKQKRRAHVKKNRHAERAYRRGVLDGLEHIPVPISEALIRVIRKGKHRM